MSSNSNSLFINPNLFFQIEDGKILVWDYKNHKQFLLENEYFQELLHIAKYQKSNTEEIGSELLNANIVSLEAAPIKSWGWDILAKIFHLGTKDVADELLPTDPKKFTQKYLEENNHLKNNIPPMFTNKEGEIIDLPQPNLKVFDTSSLLSVLKKRKTCRSFNSLSISKEELSSILFLTFGLVHENWQEFSETKLKKTAFRKTSPASGGIHSEEIYLVIFRVSDLEPGLYYYHVQEHKLVLIKTGEFEDEVIQMNYSQYFSKGLAFGIYITSRFEKIWWKYRHSRAYRSVLLDIGHLSQTFLLNATALGLQTWLSAAFHDSKVENFLNVESSSENVMLFVGAGKGKEQAIPDQIKEFLISKD